MKKILLIGAGGHCKSCIDVIEQIGDWQIAGIIDRKESGVTDVLGYPVIGSDEDLPDLKKEYSFAFVTLGQLQSSELKMGLFNKLKSLGFILPSLQSPLSYVSKHAVIGEGTIVMHGAVINAGAFVGDNCIINSKALIEHDARVGNHCHISTNATVNGGVSVGDESFIGSAATTKQSISIPAKSYLKAGTVIK